jgi:uncharacterized protein
MAKMKNNAAQAQAPAKPKKEQPARKKHVPQRTCIACRTHDAKRGLVRLVRTPEGNVEVDGTGKKNGRGAYLCRARECWETALNKRALDNALKTQIPPEARVILKEYGAKLPSKSETAVAATPEVDNVVS